MVVPISEPSLQCHPVRAGRGEQDVQVPSDLRMKQEVRSRSRGDRSIGVKYDGAYRPGRLRRHGWAQACGPVVHWQAGVGSLDSGVAADSATGGGYPRPGLSVRI